MLATLTLCDAHRSGSVPRMSSNRVAWLSVVAMGALSLAAASCSSGSEGGLLETETSALKRREVEGELPDRVQVPDAGTPDAAPPPKGATVVMIPGVVLANPTPPPSYCSPRRYVLRRLMTSPTCLGLPGIVTETDGTKSLYGTGGRFRISTLPVAASAPAELKERSCGIVWERTCTGGANPDLAKLALAPRESLVQSDWALFGGSGHCDVCGYATQTHMWAILPGWRSFSYNVAGHHYYQVLPEVSTVADMPLEEAISGTEDVTLYYGDTAP